MPRKLDLTKLVVPNVGWVRSSALRVDHFLYDYRNTTIPDMDLSPSFAGSAVCNQQVWVEDIVLEYPDAKRHAKSKRCKKCEAKLRANPNYWTVHLPLQTLVGQIGVNCDLLRYDDFGFIENDWEFAEGTVFVMTEVFGLNEGAALAYLTNEIRNARRAA
jgi:hypothetical protein